MLGFGGSKGVPSEVMRAGLSEWYEGLSDADKVKSRRYLPSAGASPSSFFVSMARAAAEDGNHNFVLALAKSTGGVPLSKTDAYDLNEVVIPSLFHLGRYDICSRRCDVGLEMLKDAEVREHVLARGNGAFPEDVNCRNYKLNVIVGVYFEYGEGDALLDSFVNGGLISAEEAAHRKNSIRTFGMQRALDGIFSIGEKDG